MRIQNLVQHLFARKMAAFHDHSGELVPLKQVCAEFDAIKNHLLAHGRDNGVVAINLTYGHLYLLTIYACMELGLTYIPLRPSWPAARVEQIRRVSGFDVLVDESNIEDICKQRISPTRQAFAIKPGQPLYIIFTSGSTGEPKGVVISREAFTHFLGWIDPLIPVDDSNRILFVADFSFDMSLLDIGLHLLKQCQCFFSQFGGNIFCMASEIESYGINSIASVPNNISMLLQDEVYDRSCYDSLRYLLLGGSRFAYGLYKDMFRRLPNDVRVFNFYGPTEVTVYCHYQKLVGNESDEVIDNTVTIGKAAPRLDCLLLDDHGNEIAAARQKGELLVGGPQVMTEYLADPERTAQYLLVHNEVVYYRTGDVAFRDDNGNYYITGRKDDTIKRRGYRINLLDIDSYIQKTDFISECLTIAIPDAAADHLLVSFVVPKQAIPEAELRKRLSEVLVDYQVPDFIEFRSALPTNNSGKVSRELLTIEFLAQLGRRAA